MHLDTTNALPLYFTCLKGLKKTTTVLIQKGADINYKRGRYTSTLYAALAGG